MSDGMIGFLIILAGIGILFSKKKKEPQEGVVFIDVETWEVTTKKRGSGLLNIVIVGASIFFIWSMNH